MLTILLIFLARQLSREHLGSETRIEPIVSSLQIYCDPSTAHLVASVGSSILSPVSILHSIQWQLYECSDSETRSGIRMTTFDSSSKALHPLLNHTGRERVSERKKRRRKRERKKKKREEERRKRSILKFMFMKL